ncbi:hypothetical protein G6L34_01990 [Agrobacterium tumefaciens]|uniref:hypothetical protein n=1 Tax=Agrobacterium tumefaciens TaxID=358 RepID=UPI0015720E3F|nr:hypothetical protein [Agrobacterium tumefaciens]NTA46863.1 hypothetical protein [Agrobacterium tumefaciens]
MNKKQESLGYWVGWFVAFGIAAVFFVYVVWQSPNLRALACNKGETDCFRQWLSASGSWVALIAAVPTLIFLSRQIRDTDRHHRVSTALNLRRLRSIARNIDGSSKHASAIAQHWMSIFAGINSAKIPILNKRRELLDTLDSALIYLTDRNIEAFEAEIYLPLDPVSFLCSELQKIRDKIAGRSEVLAVNEAREIAGELHEFHALIKRYMDELSMNAHRFLEDTKHYASLRDD